jgi:hypothetical protein
MRQMNPRKSDLSQHRLRRVIADAVSEKTQGDPHEYATRRWGADRPPPMIERAGVSGTVSGDASPFASESQATRLSYQQARPQLLHRQASSTAFLSPQAEATCRAALVLCWPTSTATHGDPFL